MNNALSCGQMEIKLVSPDVELYELCRDLLATLPGTPGVLSQVTTENAGTDADLYIWDYHPKFAIPEQTGPSPSKHLFMVDRNDLPEFRQRAGAGAEANILLKPATRSTLAAFLGLAVSSRAAWSLRADRDEILQCLIQTNLKLQEYDQDRTNFLARAVHDFRAPLTALSGYCGLLLGEPLGTLNEDQKEVLQRMQNSAKRLSRMASAMFQLSVERQVTKHPNLEKADIRECLEQALHEIGPFADEKRISITPDVEPCDEPLHFEADQIQQVLINILDNACKFTPKAGSIEVRAYAFFWDRRGAKPEIPQAIDRRVRAVHQPNSYRVDIRDSGAPIPETLVERIFEEYTSYGGGKDRSGGGLGLSICRMIVSRHSGRIWVENTASGPMFSFVLPMQRSAQAANGAEYRRHPEICGEAYAII
jgi:signal transduction histidine kinase